MVSFTFSPTYLCLLTDIDMYTIRLFLNVFSKKEDKKIKNLSTKKHAEIRGWYKVTAGGFSSRGEKTKCPLFFGCTARCEYG